MAKKIAVNTDTLKKDIDTLQTHLNSIEKDLNKMYESVRILDSMWDGPANDAFNRQFESDRRDMEGLCKTIKSIIKSLEYARTKYNACESTVGGIVAGIKV